MIAGVIKAIFLPVLVIFITMNAYAQYSDGSDQISPPTSLKTMILCPTYTVAAKENGANLPTVNLNSSTQTVKLGDAECVSGPYTGAVAYVAYLGGGAFNFDCPADHPYVGSISETWALVMVFSVLGMGGGMNVQCCSGPKPEIYLSNSQTLDWKQGPACP